MTRTEKRDFISALNIDKLEKSILRQIEEYAGKDGDCYPSIATLSRATSMAPSTVQRKIDSLKAAGILRVTARNAKGEKGRSTRNYEIIYSTENSPSQKTASPTTSSPTDPALPISLTDLPSSLTDPGAQPYRSGAPALPTVSKESCMESFNENTKEIGKAVGKAKTPPRDPRKTPPVDPWFRNDELEDLIAKMKAVWDSTWKSPEFRLFPAQKTIINRYIGTYGAETLSAAWEWLCTSEYRDAAMIRKKWRGILTFLKEDKLCDYIQTWQNFVTLKAKEDAEYAEGFVRTQEEIANSKMRDAKADASWEEEARKKAADPDYLNPKEWWDLYSDYTKRSSTLIPFEVFKATRPDIAKKQKFLEERKHYKPSPEGAAELDKLRRVIAEEKAKKEDDQC